MSRHLLPRRRSKSVPSLRLSRIVLLVRVHLLVYVAGSHLTFTVRADYVLLWMIPLLHFEPCMWGNLRFPPLLCQQTRFSTGEPVKK